MFGYNNLRDAIRSERETNKLVSISPDFFERAAVVLTSMRKKGYAAENPFSDEAQTLILETKSFEETLFELFSLRLSKIISLAESQAQGNYIERNEIKKMIPPEHEMFERISDAIGACQGTLLTQIRQSLPIGQGEAPALAQEQGALQEPVPDTAPALAPLSPPYALVRVLADMDAFMGVDGRIYTLAKGDIVTLPERNAEVLVERNIALNMNLSK